MQTSKPLQLNDFQSNLLHFLTFYFFYWAWVSTCFYIVGVMLCLFGLVSNQIPSGKFPDWNSIFFGYTIQKFLFLISLVAGFTHWLINKNAYAKEGIRRIPFNTNQEIYFELNLPFDKAFNLCIFAVRTLNRLCWLQQSDDGARTIKFVIKNKTIDRGILVTFTFLEEVMGIQKIKLTSQSRTLTPLIDNAIQMQRIKAIISFLKQAEEEFSKKNILSPA